MFSFLWILIIVVLVILIILTITCNTATTDNVVDNTGNTDFHDINKPGKQLPNWTLPYNTGPPRDDRTRRLLSALELEWGIHIKISFGLGVNLKRWTMSQWLLWWLLWWPPCTVRHMASLSGGSELTWHSYFASSGAPTRWDFECFWNCKDCEAARWSLVG